MYVKYTRGYLGRASPCCCTQLSLSLSLSKQRAVLKELARRMHSRDIVLPRVAAANSDSPGSFHFCKIAQTTAISRRCDAFARISARAFSLIMAWHVSRR